MSEMEIKEVVIPGATPGRTPRIYKQYFGVHYSRFMPDELIKMLTNVMGWNLTVRVNYGDPDTGLDTLEEADNYGRISRTTGVVKEPIICHPRSHGGFLLGRDIVRLRKVGGYDLWKHPHYHHPKITLCDIDETVDGRRYLAEVLADGKKHAAFKSMRAAKAWITRMGLLCTAIMDKRGRLAEPKLVLPPEQLRSLIFEEDDWD